MTSRRSAERLAIAAVGVALLVYPLVVGQYWTVQIGIRALWLGTVALSLVFLSGYGGMVSLGQTAIYGTAGYGVALLTVKHGVDWPVAIPVAIALAVAVALILGIVSAGTQGIYFLMITLAFSVLAYYFALQARDITYGFGGVNDVVPPYLEGVVDLSKPTSFYYAAVAVALFAYGILRYAVRTPFGLALQGVRDNPTRMSALGYNVSLHRILAFTLAGVVAALGGVVAVFYNGAISPGSIDVTRTVDILVVAVLGGLGRLEGVFVGGFAFAVLESYSSDYTARYNTLIGVVFVLVVWLSPGGLLGIAESVLRLGRGSRRSGGPRAAAGPGGDVV